MTSVPHIEESRTYPVGYAFGPWAEQIQARRAGYLPTWGLHPAPQRQLVTDAASWEAAMTRAGYQSHYRDPESDTKLGQCDIADKKRKEDEAAGGIIALALRRR